jgi:fluoroquinolone resistance protein
MIVEDESYSGVDFSTNPPKTGEYDGCIFTNCNLSHSDLTDFIFVDCTFDACNLSNAKLITTTIRDCIFKSCKLLGLHFEDCNQFGLSASFEKCNLNFSSFFKAKMKKTRFTNCTLNETDFTQSDFSESIFTECDFAKARFENTALEKADFRTAFNYSIDPERNRIKKAKFSLPWVVGLLDGYAIEIEKFGASNH